MTAEQALAETAPTTTARRWGAPHLIALTLVMGAAAFCLAPPSDPDVWWHVRTGDWILDHHRLPTVDTWSIGGAGHTWVAHAWLSEIVIALFHKALGLTGLSVFRSLGVGVLLSCLAVQAFRRTSSGRALLVTTLAVFGSQGGWGERPQLLTFLLLIPFAQLVRSAVAGSRSIWWVVPLTYLWANLHGLWFLGPCLVALGAFGMAVGHPGARAASARPFLLACAASVTVAGLTPNGPKLLLQPLRVNGYGQFVSEWGPPDIHSVFGLGFFAMLATFLVVYARADKKADPYALAQLLFAAFLGLLYIRTIAPAVVLLTPLLADALAVPLAGRRGSRFPQAFVMGCAALLGVLGVAGGATVLIAEPDLPPHAPVAATQALRDAVPDGAGVLDEYGMGGWLLLFAPDTRPAIDGRAEIYSLTFVADYINATKLAGDWKKTILPLHAQGALLHVDVPLVNGLRDELRWRTIYKDDTWLVLVPPADGAP